MSFDSLVPFWTIVAIDQSSSSSYRYFNSDFRVAAFLLVSPKEVINKMK